MHFIVRVSSSGHSNNDKEEEEVRVDGWVAIMLYFQMVLSSVGVVMHLKKRKKEKNVLHITRYFS